MKYVLIMIAVLTVGIINGLLRLPKKGDGKVVRPPIFFLIVGVLGAVGFLVPVFITVIKGEKSWVPIGFSVFSAIAVSIVIVYLNCRIVYDDEGFTVGNFSEQRKGTAMTMSRELKRGKTKSAFISAKRLLRSTIAFMT